jgi:hypothetical protein
MINKGLPPDHHEPVGTNLFTAEQTTEMLTEIAKDEIEQALSQAYEQGKNTKGSAWREGYQRGREEVREFIKNNWSTHLGGNSIISADELLMFLEE